MNDHRGIPAAPFDRDLPNHRRIREEILMKIDPEDKQASLGRKWGVPLGVAAGVAAMSVAAVAVLGGTGAARPTVAAPALGYGIPSSAATAPSPTTTPSSASGGAGSAPTGTRGTVAPVAYTITSTTTTPIDAGTAGRLLASCLGSAASAYHVVIAVRTPIAAADADGVVVAVNSAGQYVQCETTGDKATSPDSPPTFINNRMWGTGHTIEYFDSSGYRVGQGKFLSLGAGHYTSNVAKITISYGKDPKQYPAIMAGGAFFYANASSTGTADAKSFTGPNAFIHAYDASGAEIYNQQKDPLLN